MPTKLPSINRVQLAGRLCASPELRYTTEGIPVANMRLACNRSYRNSEGEWEQDATFISIVAWRAVAENCTEFLHKGSAVYIEGRLHNNTWTTEDGSNRSIIEVVASSVQFLDKRDEDEEAEEETEEEEEKEEDEDSDDLPF